MEPVDRLPVSPVDAWATPGVAPPPETPEGRRRRGRRKRTGAVLLVEWVVLIVGALTLALLIKMFLFQAFYIPSESMDPTLKKDDRVLVNKLSYKMHDVNRGDIIVFKAPPGVDESIKDLVKRVIALPGETVEGKEAMVWIDGEPLEESYLPEGVVTLDFPATMVPPESYWVMGDNRINSQDSRVFQFVPEGDIVGRVFIRILPVTRIGLL